MATGAFTYHVLWNNFNGDSTGDSKGAGLEKTNVYSFWHSRWSEKFQDTGRPPNNWQSDFFQHDVITWLELDGKVKACHLYSFYDLNQVQESEYFRYLQGDSVQNILNGFGPRTMTMEYLCASGGREEVPLTLGATMIALGSRLAFAENCTSVLGMPIDGTSVSRKVKDLGMGAICIEKGIQKYGYQLRLLATNPFVAMANEPASAKHWLNELWDQRSTSLQPPLVMTA